MTMQEKVADFPIFQGFSETEREELLAIGEETDHQAGDVLVEASSLGEDADFFVILRGMVKVEIETGTEIDPKRLAILKTGDVFGERSLLQSRQRSARVIAYSGDLKVFRIKNSRLMDLLSRNYRVGWLMMRNLAAILADRVATLNFMWRDAT